MAHDEIIQEVRDNREAYEERFGCDVWALYHDAREHEGAGGREIVSLKPHRIEPAAGGGLVSHKKPDAPECGLGLLERSTTQDGKL